MRSLYQTYEQVEIKKNQFPGVAISFFLLAFFLSKIEFLFAFNHVEINWKFLNTKWYVFLDTLY